jgi:hypothetical protein
MQSPSAAYLRRLARVVRQPGVELEALQKIWPEARKNFVAKRRKLLASVPEDDPVRLTVDLLHSIKCAADETLHTQALAYALDPMQGHEFGKSIAEALVETIADLRPRAGAARVLRRIRRKNVTLSVRPEYRYRVEGYRNRSIARSDIWVEARVRNNSALIIIENKVGAAESKGQLSWYEQKARSWCRKEGHSRCLLIFLTPDGRPARTAKKSRWISISYLQLAAALRIAWRRTRSSAGHGWLGLYIASITRGLLGMQPEEWDSVSLSDIQTYLGVR